MGRNIYLTNKEIQALRSSAAEWCDMIGEGEDETCLDALNERLENGLGSALRKLYKGCNGESVYRKYKTKRK